MKKLILYLFIGSACLTQLAQAQSPEAVIDVQHYGFNIQLSDATDLIKGKADISITFLKTPASFKIDLVKKKPGGKGMTVSRVLENGKAVRFQHDADVLTIFTKAVENSTKTYSITYQGVPDDGLIISKNKYGKRTFFGDNWPNRAHNWIPCVDEPADKASVDFTVTAPDHYQVVANGLKISETALPGQLKVTHWAETAQLPTKVMVIGVAGFAVDHPKDVDDIPVYSYVFPENAAAGFRNYAAAGEILPFFIKNIGPYDYKKLANIQSKTIFGGMENAGAIFYHEESVTDQGIESLMAHEIAHQWFGDAVSENNFHHLWLSEGFATYLTNYYIESKYGADSLRSLMDEQRVKIFKFEKSWMKPVIDTTVAGNYMPLLNPNSYEKGAWVLHMLRRKIGDGAFFKGLNTYYLKYRGGNATTTDFMEVMQNISGQKLAPFFDQWLRRGGNPDLDVKWSYDTKTHVVDVVVHQKQGALYTFPLEISIDGMVHTIDITEKTTTAHIAAGKKSPVIKVDPAVNLLARFTVTAQ